MIRVNYDRAYAEANRLRNAAEECENIVRQSKQNLADIHMYWEGAAANEFIAVNENWCREMQSIITELNEVSRLIQKVTDDIREVDTRAAAAAKNA